MHTYRIRTLLQGCPRYGAASIENWQTIQLSAIWVFRFRVVAVSYRTTLLGDGGVSEHRRGTRRPFGGMETAKAHLPSLPGIAVAFTAFLELRTYRRRIYYIEGPAEVETQSPRSAFNGVGGPAFRVRGPGWNLDGPFTRELPGSPQAAGGLPNR